MTQSGKFRSVSLFSIQPDEPLPFRLAIHFKGQNLVYRIAGQSMEKVIYDKFICRQIHRVLVPEEDFESYLSYQKTKQQERDASINDKKTSEDKKELIKLIYQVQDVANDMFSSPNDEALTENIRKAMEVSKNTVKSTLSKSYIHIYEMLSYKGDSIVTHSTRVSVLATFLAHQLGFLNPLALEHIAGAALVHDIGKIRLGIKEDFDATGQLADVDESLMRQHPSVGCDILSRINFVPMEVIRIVREHHEAKDGTGYPNKLMGPKIYGLSKVFIIANTFDNLASQLQGSIKDRKLYALKKMLEDEKCKIDNQMFPKAMKILSGTALLRRSSK